MDEAIVEKFVGVNLFGRAVLPGGSVRFVTVKAFTECLKIEKATDHKKASC